MSTQRYSIEFDPKSFHSWKLATVSQASLRKACYAHLWCVCARYSDRNSVMLGGRVIHTTKSCLVHRRCDPVGSMQAFGIVDTSVSPAFGYMEITENQKADTFLPTVERIVHPGTTIHSDCWKARLELYGKELDHGTVNHTPILQQSSHCYRHADNWIILEQVADCDQDDRRLSQESPRFVSPVHLEKLLCLQCLEEHL